MPENDFCNNIEQAMVELLNDGHVIVKSKDIARRADIRSGDFQSPAQKIGYSLAYGGCRNLDRVEWEIIAKDNRSNRYRLQRE